MATLESKIETLLDVALQDGAFNDFAEADRTEVAAMAGAYVKSFKNATSTDYFAVDMGLKYALIIVKQWLRMATEETLMRETDVINQALQRWAQGAKQTIEPQLVTSEQQDDSDDKWDVPQIHGGATSAEDILDD
jgi:hypothetical protein